jgi:hypothetical protein
MVWAVMISRTKDYKPNRSFRRLSSFHRRHSSWTFCLGLVPEPNFGADGEHSRLLRIQV